MKSFVSFSTRFSSSIAALLISLACGPNCLGQPSATPRHEVWRTDGPVHATAAYEGILYLGGNFRYVGPGSGAAGVVSLADAQSALGFPVLNGTVSAVVPDGADGWFVGGSFTTVEDRPRTNLVHLRNDLSLNPNWKPNPDGGCATLTLHGRTLYVGGAFGRIGGQARSGVAALDAATGAVSAEWNPNVSGSVVALQISGDRVYLGGDFRRVGGQTRNRIASVELASGKVTDWNPNALASVEALAIAGEIVYAGGTFTTIGGKPRNRIAALDANTGVALDWNPNADGAVEALLLDGLTVYVGGSFTSIGGFNRNRLAALDADTGLANSWDPGANGTVFALARLNTRLFVGGAFTSVGGETRTALAAFDTATGGALPWIPRISGLTPAVEPAVYALGLDGESVGFGGKLASSGGSPRNNLAAIDAQSGRLLPWNPISSGVVNALVATSDRVYIGGTFTNIGRAVRHHIAAVDAETGDLLDWDPHVIGRNATVSALAMDANNLYVGGSFTNISGETRMSIAALDLNTGAAKGWDPGATTSSRGPGSVRALLLVGDVLYAGGEFANFGGQPRASIAAVHTTADRALDWNPGANDDVSCLGWSGGNVFVGGAFTRIGGQTRNRIAALDDLAGTASVWNPDAVGRTASVNCMETHGERLYAGGSYTGLGGEFRNQLASLNITGAKATDWNPNPNGLVRCMVVTADTVYVGGDFTQVGGRSQAYLAAFSLAPVFAINTLGMPNATTFSMEFTSGDGAGLILQASPDLKTWETIGTPALLNKTVEFSDTEADLFPRRFYRVLLTPP